ncbi:hypothetical protein Hanom_Chr12g01120581 [Helianthus anomalus]
MWIGILGFMHEMVKALNFWLNYLRKNKSQSGLQQKRKNNLQKSSFTYVTYCKLCTLSIIITENILDVCKPLQVMSFSSNSVNFRG